MRNLLFRKDINLKNRAFYVEVSGYASMDYTFRAKNPSITTTYTTTTDPNMTTDESFTESTTATTATKKSETSPVQTTVTTEMDHYRYTGTTGTSRPRLTSDTTETTVSKHDDTNIIEVPMTIRVLDESPNDEMYLPGVAFQVISEETGEVIHQFVYDGGDFSFLLEYGKTLYNFMQYLLPEGYQLQNEGRLCKIRRIRDGLYFQSKKSKYHHNIYDNNRSQYVNS